jgi:hypothetical protein
MSTDFTLVTNRFTFPESKVAQINLVLHGSVSEAVYKINNQSPPPKMTDYTHLFSITYDDLVAYLSSNVSEFESILPGSSWDGLSVKKEGGQYIFRWHDRGVPMETEGIPSKVAAIHYFLRNWLLPSQGLRKIMEKQIVEQIVPPDR